MVDGTNYSSIVQNIALTLPILVVAGSAVGYVINLFKDRKNNRRKDFFELMEILDGNAPIAGKLASVYHLRYFPEHHEFIVRFCESQKNNITGAATLILVNEFQKTIDYYSKH